MAASLTALLCTTCSDPGIVPRPLAYVDGNSLLPNNDNGAGQAAARASKVSHRRQDQVPNTSLQHSRDQDTSEHKPITSAIEDDIEATPSGLRDNNISSGEEYAQKTPGRNRRQTGHQRGHQSTYYTIVDG